MALQRAEGAMPSLDRDAALQAVADVQRHVGDEIATTDDAWLVSAALSIELFFRDRDGDSHSIIEAVCDELLVCIDARDAPDQDLLPTTALRLLIQGRRFLLTGNARFAGRYLTAGLLDSETRRDNGAAASFRRLTDGVPWTGSDQHHARVLLEASGDLVRAVRQEPRVLRKLKPSELVAAVRERADGLAENPRIGPWTRHCYYKELYFEALGREAGGAVELRQKALAALDDLGALALSAVRPPLVQSARGELFG